MAIDTTSPRTRRTILRRPHPSTGAWLFCGLVAAALITPAGVYAAVNSHVAIGNVGNATTATVTTDHQLLTAVVPPHDILRFTGGPNAKGVIYDPPPGKALMLTNVTFDLYGTAGTRSYVFLVANASTLEFYDGVETTLAHVTEQHTYPTGLPMPLLRIMSSYGLGTAWGEGYLISDTELPANVPLLGKVAPHGLPHR
jgi:hypothetical protein